MSSPFKEQHDESYHAKEKPRPKPGRCRTSRQLKEHYTLPHTVCSHSTMLVSSVGTMGLDALVASRPLEPFRWELLEAFGFASGFRKYFCITMPASRWLTPFR